MRNECLTKNQLNKPINQNDVLKQTALIYFKEALENQLFEDCCELINAAKKYGARQSEVRKVIIEYIQVEKEGQPQEGAQRIGAHLRFN